MEDILRKIAVIFALISMAFGAFGLASAQKPTDWTNWSDKDVKKILDNSGWGQVQTDTITSEMFFKQASRRTARTSEDANNQSPSISYHIRFISAKPVREALARRIMLDQKIALTDPKSDPIKAFVDRSADQWIVVAVAFDSSTGRIVGPAVQAFASANLGVLKNTAYLERKDGKRIFIEQYHAPGPEGFGAQFTFPRMSDGKPFITGDSGTVRFYAEIPSESTPDPNSSNAKATTNIIKLDMKFKVAEMMYDGKLEY